MRILEFDFRTEAQPDDSFTLFLHGFPGYRSQQNRAIAEAVLRENRGRGAVLLYSGLGFAPGQFSFRGCRDEVAEYVQKLTANHGGPIDLVGHSWGGFLSLSLAGLVGETMRRLVLLSPLLEFMPADVCIPWFANTAATNPELDLGDIHQLVSDFVEVGETASAHALIEQLPSSVETLFLQAKEDSVTPTTTAQRAQSAFSRPALFELVETDHSFIVDRPGITFRIARFLRSGT